MDYDGSARSEPLAFRATATIPTQRGGRYAKQLISHWGRHAESISTDDAGTLMEFAASERWPASAVHVQVTADALVVRSYAPTDDALDEGNASLAEHLHRFAGRHEALEIDWI